MRRDLELIRSILLDIEKKAPSQNEVYYSYLGKDDRDHVADSLRLMLDRGLIVGKYQPTMDMHSSEGYTFVRLTWEGCDFLDSIRDPEIWRQTKEGAAAAKGFSYELIKALAKAFLKKKIEQHTGVTLEI